MIEYQFLPLPTILFIHIEEKKITGHESLVLNAIFYKTLQFQKFSEFISIPDICKFSGLDKKTVLKCLQTLDVKNYITIKKEIGKTNLYTINKCFFMDKNISTSTKNGTTTSTENGTTTGTENGTTTSTEKGTSLREPKEKKRIIKETTTKKDAQALVVVFSSLEKYKFSEKYKLKICSEYSEKQINLALKRLDQMKNKKNLEACMIACLKNEKIWVDKMNESEIQEKNFEFLQTLKHLDGKNILSVDIAVGRFYIEFSGGQSIKTFDVKDENFIDKVQDMLNKMKIRPLKGTKIEQIDASNTKVPAKNLASK